ncbi:MAG: hypothetical protein SPJ14_02535 [Succinivibrio sp.]|nr:hypothetical protein [Succinivibrio sp.]
MSLAPVYVFSSDDPFLKNERSKAVIAQARQELPQAEFMLFTSSDLTSGSVANLARLENELIDPGLFGGDRIIKIYLNDLNSIAVQVLQLLAMRSRPGVVTVVEIGRINSALAKTAAGNSLKDDFGKTKSIDGKAKIVIANLKFIGAQIEVMYPPEGDKFSMWIRNHARNKFSLSVQDDALEFLSLSCEGNLVAVDQFFELVKITTSSNVVTLQLASDYISGNSRYTGFEFAEAAVLGGKNSIRALNILSSLTQTSSLSQVLPLVIGNFDRLLYAIGLLRGHSELLTGRVNYKDKMMFFKPLRISALSTMDATTFAAKNMPQDFYDYLVSELALASKAYQAFNNDEALMHLQNMAVSTCNSNVRALKAL